MRIRSLLSQERVQQLIVCAWVSALEHAFGQARVVLLRGRTYASNLTIASEVIVLFGKRFCRVVVLRFGLGWEPRLDQTLAAGKGDIGAVEDDVCLAEGVLAGGTHRLVYCTTAALQSSFFSCYRASIALPVN